MPPCGAWREQKSPPNFFVCFLRVSQCVPGWPGGHYVNQSASQVKGTFQLLFFVIFLSCNKVETWTESLEHMAHKLFIEGKRVNPCRTYLPCIFSTKINYWRIFLPYGAFNPFPSVYSWFCTAPWQLYLSSGMGQIKQIKQAPFHVPRNSQVLRPQHWIKQSPALIKFTPLSYKRRQQWKWWVHLTSENLQKNRPMELGESWVREYSPSMYSTLALSSAQQAHAHAHTHKLKTNYKTKNQK